ncbi:PadR family transcriptional regulator [soil metagenome]
MKKSGGATSKALLGLLSIHPMSGYDMRQLIPRSIGHFWSESYGQIYPALKQMTAEGLVIRKSEQHEGRPDRHVYSLTKEGRAELRTWLKAAPVEEVPRSELLLKVFFGAHAEKGVNREHIAAFLATHEQALKIYTATEKRLKKEEAQDPQLPYWLMTLSFGRHRSKASVKWATETLAELDRLEK